MLFGTRGKPVIIDAGGDLKEEARDSGTSVNDKPLAAATHRMQAVATLPGLPSALLVRVDLPGQPSTCRLLEDAGNRVRITQVSRCDDRLHAEPLTNDQAWRDTAKSIKKVPGRIDRETFMRAGTYLFSEAIFDSGQRTVRRIAPMVYANGFNAGVAPLGISPDGRSIVRAGFSETERGAPALLVFDTEAKTPYLVAIDQLATRYAGSDALDITWLAHYYHWQRGADGQDRLVARTAVKPLPYRGVLYTDGTGSVVYHVQPSGQAMCDVLAEFLRTEFNAQRVTKEEWTQGYKMTIGDAQVHVSVNKDEHQVAVFLDNSSDRTLVPRIAERFNAVLATGQYDRLFGR